jgi:2-amino-4-hydroxy-6-hydroxymethyldihydropteridine diphosphokinase
MSKSHLAYLSLGSNIQPELNLVRAVELLRDYGEIQRLSSAWESESVGAEGPNYLNACVLLITPLEQVALKEEALHPIETKLGRKRSENRFEPRPMDIDILLFDGKWYNDRYFEQAFVIVPLAEIDPDLENPIRRESIRETAARLRREFWMEARRGVLSQFSRDHFSA